MTACIFSGRTLFLWGVIWLGSMLCSGANAHVLHFGVLTVTSMPESQWLVDYRYSGDVTDLDRMAVTLPETCQDLSPTQERREVNAKRLRRKTVCNSDNGPAWVRVAGLTRADARVLARFVSESGNVIQEEMLDASTPVFTPAAKQEATEHAPVVTQYVGMGFMHLLLGIDHLAFVLLLILVAGTLRKTLVAATAFTVGHSLTLLATVSGWIVFDSVFAELLIALSILLLAVDVSRHRAGTPRFLYATPGLFGLVHGLGFANVLQEAGLPPGERLSALLWFNIGIEIGQMVFVALVYVLLRMLAAPARVQAGRWLTDLCGIAGGYWLFTRWL